MKSLIIIPARYASTRFPGKPLAKIGDREVVLRVVEQAGKVTDAVYVATDDERIEKAVVAGGGKAVMTSPDHRSGTDRCYEAYGKIAALTGESYDVVVNVQGDEPFIAPEQIRVLISCFEDPEVDIATLAKKFVEPMDIFDENKVKVVKSVDGSAIYFSRNPIPFCRGVERKDWLQHADFYKHVGMYAYRPSVLEKITRLPQGMLEKAESLEQLRWLENGYRIAVRETFIESIGIDTPADLEKAQAYFLEQGNK